MSAEIQRPFKRTPILNGLIINHAYSTIAEQLTTALVSAVNSTLFRLGNSEVTRSSVTLQLTELTSIIIYSIELN